MLLSNGDNLWGSGRGGEEETGSLDVVSTWSLEGDKDWGPRELTGGDPRQKTGHQGNEEATW